VSRSVIRLIVSTAPYCSKSWRSSCYVAVNDRLPTKIFTEVPSRRMENDRQVIRTVCRSEKAQEHDAGEAASEA
jgi:hypothetical protein